MTEVEPQYRLVKMTSDQAALIRSMCVGLKPIVAEPLLQLCDEWDKAPDDYWDQIATEFLEHRCTGADCFTESVLMRLGVLSFGSYDNPFGV